MGIGVSGDVVGDHDGVHHPWVADDLGEFDAFVRAVESRRHQHGDRLGCDAGVEQRPHERGQEQAVGHRPRDVAHQDAGVACSSGGVGQRDRTDRPDKRIGDRGHRIAEDLHRTLGDDGDVEFVREVDRQRAAAVVQPDLHVRHRTPGAAPATTLCRPLSGWLARASPGATAIG